MRIVKMTVAAIVVMGFVVSAQVTPDTTKNSKSAYKSRTFAFDKVVVQGYNDNPSAHIVPGYEHDDTTEIRLERSFKNELTSNVDKETVERMN